MDWECVCGRGGGGGGVLHIRVSYCCKIIAHPASEEHMNVCKHTSYLISILQVSLFGDAIGIVSAAFYVLYLSIGRTLRTWLPIFAYVFPLFSLATITLALAALITEGAKFDTSTSGLFGQYVSWHYLWRTLYLGAVPGILGHVSFNALLKWLNPLIIALAGIFLFCSVP